MKLFIGLVFLLVALAAPAAALPCSEFAQALAASIHRSGDKVVAPVMSDLSGQPLDKTIKNYGLAGIAGLAGGGACTNGNFYNLEAKAKFDADPAENEMRLDRGKALLSAVLCLFEQGLTPGACQKAMDALVRKATTRFLADKRKGELMPTGSADQTFPDGPVVHAFASKGSLTLGLVMPPQARGSASR